MGQNDQFCIRLINESDYDAVAQMMATAFLTNPAYALIFKNSNSLFDGLLWLFKANLKLHNSTQKLTHVIVDRVSGDIVGTYTLIPPEGVKTSGLVYFNIQLPSFVLKFGVKPILRMQKLDSLNKLTISNSMERSKFHYLSMVVIHVDYQGRGIGSLAIKHAIDNLAVSDSACEIIGLTTQLPENVTFYSRLGFEKINEGYIEFKGDRYYNYDMKLSVFRK